MKEVRQQHIAWLGILGDVRCEVNACSTVARIGYDGSKRGVRPRRPKLSLANYRLFPLIN